MKVAIKRILAATLVWLAMTALVNADTWFGFTQGYGIQSQTNYDETYDFDYGMGFSGPVVSASSFPYGGSTVYALTVTVDTDYAADTYHVGYLSGAGGSVYVQLF